jgi:hypothetical protein
MMQSRANSKKLVYASILKKTTVGSARHVIDTAAREIAGRRPAATARSKRSL